MKKKQRYGGLWKYRIQSVFMQLRGTEFLLELGIDPFTNYLLLTPSLLIWFKVKAIFGRSPAQSDRGVYVGLVEFETQSKF